MLANRIYPPLVHYRRWARNGMVPDAKFAKALIRAQNHVVAYRRKTFLTAGDWANAFAGAAGSTVMHRFRCHTGYGASHITFDLLVAHAHGDGFGDDPIVQIDVTEAGGATTTVTRHIGQNTDNGGVSNDSPDIISELLVPVPVDPDTTYEVTITAIDYARIMSAGAYEEASNVIDESTTFFVEDSPTLFFPIYDSLRVITVGGMSDMWKRNGSHLLSWTRNGATAPTFTTTTFTNIIDSTTAVASNSTPFYFGDAQTMMPWCRISEPVTLRVVLAAHGSCAGGSTGEVRLVNGSGSLVSLTGIGSTSQWYSTTTSFADISAVTRADLQARVAAGGSTLTLNAVSMYCYVA